MPEIAAGHAPPGHAWQAPDRAHGRCDPVLAVGLAPAIFCREKPDHHIQPKVKLADSIRIVPVVIIWRCPIKRDQACAVRAALIERKRNTPRPLMEQSSSL